MRMRERKKEARRRDDDLCFALQCDAGQDADGCNRLQDDFSTDKYLMAVLRAEDIVRSAILRAMRKGIPVPSAEVYRQMKRFATLRACGEYWAYLSRSLEG